MNRRIVLLVLFILAISSYSGAEEITILYTSSLNGNLDGCECKAVPKSGLVSSAVYLRKNMDNALYFDLGDSFDVYPDPDLSEAILGSYSQLGLDIAAVGDQEFVEGVDWFLEQDHPYLAGNMRIDSDNFGDAHKIITYNSVKIGVVGVIDPGTFFFASQEVKERVDLSDSREFAESALQKLIDEDVDLKVLLYHGPADKAEVIFDNQPQWDVILAGHDQRLVSRLQNRNKRFFGSPGDNGNRVGILKIEIERNKIKELSHSFRYFDYMVDPRDPQIVRILEEYKRMMIERLKK